MDKQTAVQILESLIYSKCKFKGNVIQITESNLDEIIDQAKAMEKEQIENAYWEGGQDLPLTEKRCEEYYEKTF